MFVTIVVNLISPNLAPAEGSLAVNADLLSVISKTTFRELSIYVTYAAYRMVRNINR